MHAPAATLRDPRQSARLLARCPAEIRHRFSRWRATTEDVASGGYQIVTPRLVAPGREVRLLVDVPELHRTVQGTATVVWSRPEAPSRLGVRFAVDREDRGWFEALLETDPALGRAARRRPTALPYRSQLYLGEPPKVVIDFTRDELAVLRRLRSDTVVADLVKSFGSAPDRLVGALFALLARGRIVVHPRSSPGPEAWRVVLTQAAAEAAAGQGSEPRESAVQQLLDEGRDHLAAGRFRLAAARFRAAQRLAPDDAEPSEQLRRIRPFE